MLFYYKFKKKLLVTNSAKKGVKIGGPVSEPELRILNTNLNSRIAESHHWILVIMKNWFGD